MKNLSLSTPSLSPRRLTALCFFAAAALTVASTANAFVLGPTGKWGSPVLGTGATVTYSFMAGGISVADEAPGLTTVSLDSFMPAGYKAAIEAAFDAWSAIADITFTEVVDSGDPYNAAGATGDIRIGAHAFDGAGGVLAHGFYPPPNGTSAAGDIHFDSDDMWDLEFDGTLDGFNIFQVFAHELGHAIGLDHTAVPDSLMNPFYTEAFVGLQADDIAGAQFIYGPADTTPPPRPRVPDSGATALLLGAAVAGLVAMRRKLAA